MRRDPGNEVDITCHSDDAGVLPYEYRLPPPQKPKGIFFFGLRKNSEPSERGPGSFYSA